VSLFSCLSFGVHYNWVVKGRPEENDWDKMLRPGKSNNWHAAKLPKDLTKSDRIFCWSGGEDHRIVGLAEVIRPDAGEKDGKKLFRIRYLTKKLSDSPGIGELLSVRGFKNTAFSRADGTIFRLTLWEGETLYTVLQQGCPDLGNIWPDVGNIEPDLSLSPPINIEDEDAVTEGGRRIVRHLRLERNRQIIEKKKRLARSHLECEACNFNFEKVYGPRGKEFCEVHHVLPLAENDQPVETRLKDLAIVCANCHRMLHRSPWTTIEDLKAELK